MKLKKIISVLEDCHAKLYYFCEDAESTSWYAEARKQLRHTIKFMECHLTQQCSGQKQPVCNCKEWNYINAGWCPVHGIINSCR